MGSVVIVEMDEPGEGFGSLAFSSKLVDVGSIDETTEEFPDGTGRTFSPNFVVIGASYARILNAFIAEVGHV